MVLALASYVHASITTDEYEFDSLTGFLLFLADLAIAGTLSPNLLG